VIQDPTYVLNVEKQIYDIVLNTSRALLIVNLLYFTR